MEIKCPHCSYKNLEDSQYCQECGIDLSLQNSKNSSEPLLEKDKKKETISDYKHVEEISDVIFKPKEKTGFFKRMIKVAVVLFGISLLGLLGLLVLSFIFQDGKSSSAGIQQETTTFPISNLSIENYDIVYVDSESYLTGILKNSSSKDVTNVRARLDFYNDQAKTSHFDTRRVTIEYGVDSHGAFSFQVPLYIYPEEQFWYVIQIESAEYLK